MKHLRLTGESRWRGAGSTALPFLLPYPLFLIQAALAPWFPDLLLLTVIASATGGGYRLSPASQRLFACGLGAFSGFLLDLLTPTAFGLNLFIYAGVGYGTAVLTGITLRAEWVTFPVVILAVGLRLVGGSLAGTGHAPTLPLIVSILLTLALALPWQAGVRRLFRLP